MQKTIMDIVKDVQQQEMEYGIGETTVRNYYLNYYQKIERYFLDREKSAYDPAVLQDYLDELSGLRKCHAISAHAYSDRRRCVLRVKACAETGRVDFSKYHPKVYQPSAEGMKLYDSIIDHNRCRGSISCNNQAILRNFICFLEKEGIAEKDISDDVLLDFISAARKNYEQSNGYIRQSMEMVSGYLKDQGIELKINYGALKMKGKRKRLIEPYESGEVSDMINSIDMDSGTGYRDRAIMLLAYSTGLRAVDITSLKMADIDYKNRSVSVVQSKTGGQVFLPLSTSAMNAVADYILKERPNSKDAHIFLASKAPFNPLRGSRSLGNISRKYSRKAGIEKKPGRDFHSFRRSFASGLSSAGVSLPVISEMMGHSDINSDQPYLSYNEKQMSLCARGFADIPLTRGIYSEGGGR